MIRGNAELTLDCVLAGTGGQVLVRGRARSFGGVSIDSRSVQTGDLFIALRGARADGHQFVAEAVAAGATGALVDAPFADPPGLDEGLASTLIRCPNTYIALQNLAAHWRRLHTVEVVGITGSVGKTTTKEMISDVLAARFHVLRTPANFNTEVGLPLALLSLESKHDVAVLEMGMYQRGDIERLATIAAPRIGVVTNVHPVHLERLGSIEAIADAKAEIIEALPADGLAILNSDDARVREMARRARCRVRLMGHRADADLRASGIRSFGLDGIGFIVQSDGEQHDVRVNAIGRHMVYAALASIAVGQAFGMSLEEACETLRSVARPARLIATAGINGCTILDDTYNASPPSAMAALDALAELHGRRLAVLGDMLELGSYEAEGHAEVGRRAARTVDYLVTIGTRARTIARHAAQCGLQDDLIRSFSSPEDAVTHLSRVLGPQDSVLVKGSRALGLDRIVVALSHRA